MTTDGASLRQRVAGQGALLIAGLGAAQALSFVRNALIGHALSKGDFGVAASITLILQMLEALSDLGADRLLVQARDGDEPRLQANAHVLLVLRGVVTGLALFVLAQPLAHYFRVEHALWAFQASALVPLVKGLQHLDVRRAQRRLDNRGTMLVEVVPQAIALLATVPVLRLDASFGAVVWLSLAQAALAVVVSHMLAVRPYRWAFDSAGLQRFLAFGWPILASAIPLAVIYQGDRMAIGRLLGMEALAAYSTAFMVTMVPGLMAAKVANALMLPLLAEAHRAPHGMRGRYGLMCDVTALGASIYLAGFLVAGGDVLPLAFGANYAGLGGVVGWLALMWSVRMMQAVPGMALMAAGRTRPLLVAGMLRAAAIVPAVLAALTGLGLEGIAAAGCLGEVASLLYLAHRVERCEAGLSAPLLSRTSLMAPAALLALALSGALPQPGGLLVTLPAAALLAVVLALAAVVASAELRAALWSRAARPQPA